MKRYGFLGLGIMGSAMAKNLLKAGLDVTVWNRTPAACDRLVAEGAYRGENAASVVEACDITFCMVSDPAAARAVCFGAKGVLEGIAEGKGYVDVSTVDPATASEIGAAVRERGGLFLEAPVSGTKKPAEEGTLVFLCAGDAALYEDASPALDVMGKKRFFFDETGNAATMKLVVNMIMATMMTGLCEGLALGEKAGLAVTDILEVLDQGALASPLFRIKGPLVGRRDFSPAFPLKHMQKDLRLVLGLGEDHEQSLATAAVVNALFLRAKSLGLSDRDFSAVFHALGSP